MEHQFYPWGYAAGAYVKHVAVTSSMPALCTVTESLPPIPFSLGETQAAVNDAISKGAPSVEVQAGNYSFGETAFVIGV